MTAAELESRRERTLAGLDELWSFAEQWYTTLTVPQQEAFKMLFGQFSLEDFMKSINGNPELAELTRRLAGTALAEARFRVEYRNGREGKGRMKVEG